MSAVIHDLQQGTDEWVQFRTVHFGASEAAAMLGLSPLMTRSELLRLKHTGIAKEHSEWVQEHVLDHGHRVEAAIRTHVEQLIANDLYPVTCSLPGSRISASCDGLTLEGDTAWENKQWNAELAAQVAAGTVPDSHMPQCQQVLMVTAAQRLIFTVTDGTPEKFVHAEVLPDPKWFHRIKQGWQQFEADLEGYTPPAAAPVVVAAPVEHLPALSVQVSGALAVVSNLEPFGVALRAFVAKIPAKPSTDQEFADSEAACKALKQAEDRLQQAEDSALAGMADVETMRRMVADFRGIARTARLASEKMVAARKVQIREDEVRRGQTALGEHIAALNRRLGWAYIDQVVRADFGGAIKGLKTLDSVRNAIDTTLAQAKIEANALADRIDANLKAMSTGAEGLCGLFPDMKALVFKAPDDLAAVIAQRVAQRKAADEATRQAAIDAELARQREVQAIVTPTPAVQPERIDPDVVIAQAPAARPAPADTRPPLKLGDVNALLGITMTAAFVTETLRVIALPDPKGRAVLFAAADFPRICDALVAHALRAKAAHA